MPKVNVPAGQLVRLGSGEEIQAIYQASSKSRPGTYHFVIIYKGSRGMRCTCEGWNFNGRCWHVHAVPMCLVNEPDGPRTCGFHKDHPGDKHSWEYGPKRVVSSSL